MYIISPTICAMQAISVTTKVKIISASLGIIWSSWHTIIMTVQMTLILYTATPRSVIRSSAPTVFNRRLVVVYTKYSDASPRTSVASKKMVPMMPGIKLESR